MYVGPVTGDDEMPNSTNKIVVSRCFLAAKPVRVLELEIKTFTTSSYTTLLFGVINSSTVSTDC